MSAEQGHSGGPSASHPDHQGPHGIQSDHPPQPGLPSPSLLRAEGMGGLDITSRGTHNPGGHKGNILGKGAPRGHTSSEAWKGAGRKHTFSPESWGKQEGRQARRRL